MKAILIIDMPKTCLDCRFCRELHEGIEACCEIVDDPVDDNLCRMIECEYGYCQGKPEWCPLKPLQRNSEKPTPLGVGWIAQR